MAGSRQGSEDPDQVHRCEVLASVSATVRLVLRARSLATQAETAERVLVALFAGLEAQRLLPPAALREWQSMHVTGARPHRAVARPRRARGIVDLPAWAEAIALIRGTDLLDDLTSDRVAEVGQAMQRRQAAHVVAEPKRRVACSGGDARRVGYRGRGEHALLVPGHIGGRSGQAIAWIGRQRRQQSIQPCWSDEGATLEEDDHVGTG